MTIAAVHMLRKDSCQTPHPGGGGRGGCYAPRRRRQVAKPCLLLAQLHMKQLPL